MTKPELEKQLEAANNLISDQREEIEGLKNENGNLSERVEDLAKQRADITADLIQFRTATFRLHESNAALLTLINKHQI